LQKDSIDLKREIKELLIQVVRSTYVLAIVNSNQMLTDEQNKEAFEDASVSLNLLMNKIDSL
jgi:hypothetical protein